MDYIRMNNGRDESYFPDFKGGIVSIVNVDTGECVFQTKIKNK